MVILFFFLSWKVVIFPSIVMDLPGIVVWAGSCLSEPEIYLSRLWASIVPVDESAIWTDPPLYVTWCLSWFCVCILLSVFPSCLQLQTGISFLAGRVSVWSFWRCFCAFRASFCVHCCYSLLAFYWLPESLLPTFQVGFSSLFLSLCWNLLSYHPPSSLVHSHVCIFVHIYRHF